MQNSENILGYTVVRKKVKNINLRINTDGVVYISAPLNIDKYYIEEFIKSKKAFIDKHINRIEEYKKTTANLDLYIDNSYIMLYGKRYILKLISSSNENEPIFDNNTITIHSLNLEKENIKNIVYNKIYYVIAKKLFRERLDYYLELSNEVNDIKLSIGNMKGKWGLCRPQKREIVLNIELMKKSLVEIDSVIVHEVSHLKHPNHSKNFYREIDKYFKNYKEVNKKLNQLL